ncbi:MAG: hypothetical protein AAGG44_03405 [Planctomycetota bacterium]
MNLVPILINVACGIIGGNAAGSIFKKISLGTLGNSIAGILGGGLGGQLLGMLGLSAGPDGAMELTSILGNVAAGGVGGGVVLTVVGFVKSLLSGSKASAS